jgi:RNA polymerase sigma factor (sigma-70 family)
VWQGNELEVKEARKQIVLSLLPYVSALARRFSVVYQGFNYEDLLQYGSLILLERLGSVPHDHPHPGKWLYGCVRNHFIDLLQEDDRWFYHNTVSLDRDRDHRLNHSDNEAQLHNRLAVPFVDIEARHDQLEARANALRDAIHRLPTRQQEALHAYFQFDGFVPTRNKHRIGKANDITPSQSMIDGRRKRAYQSLRRDATLLSQLGLCQAVYRQGRSS